jgi:hypothetical protein
MKASLPVQGANIVDDPHKVSLASEP